MIYRTMFFSLWVAITPGLAFAGTLPKPVQPASIGPVGAVPDRPVSRPVPADPGVPLLHYPEESRREGEEGDVVVNFLVGTDGKVSDVRVTLSSGYKRLDASAVAMALSITYKPAMQDGKPVGYRLNRAVRFRLRDVEPAQPGFLVLDGPSNAYPPDAIANRQEGVAEIALMIDEKGAVIESKILSSSGVPSLDQASLLFALQSHYEPSQIDRTPSKTYIAYFVRWSLPRAPTAKVN